MSRWIPVATEGEILPGGFKLVHVGDLDLAIFNVDGQLSCIEDLCTHDGAIWSKATSWAVWLPVPGMAPNSM